MQLLTTPENCLVAGEKDAERERTVMHMGVEVSSPLPDMEIKATDTGRVEV